MNTCKKYCIYTLLLLILPALAFGARKVKLHTIGDSTMEQQDPNVKDQRGWVQMLQSFFTKDLTVIDPAKSGTSTKTYYKNGYWAKAKKNIQPGDYVLIQFGHNDEKHNGKDGETGTFPTDSFRIYLTKYVQEVRELGAHPILCTPVVRKMFDKSGKLTRRGKHDLGEIYKQNVDANFDSKDTFTLSYPENIKFVANQMQCPLIDMTSLTAKLINDMGEEKAQSFIYNLPSDGTHFGANGALLFSKLFIDDIKRQNILTDYINYQKKLITNPGSILINRAFIGTECKSIFDVGYLGEDERKRHVKILASPGIKLKRSADASPTNELDIDYSSGNACKVYLVCVPQMAGVINGQITITANGEKNLIPVKINVENIVDKQPFSVVYKLATTSTAEISGPVSALDEMWKGTELIKYGVPENGNPAFMARVQNNNISGGSWPANEIDIVYSRYLQFGLNASTLGSAVVRDLEITVGGGTNFRIMASFSADFSNAFTVGEAADVQSMDMQKYHFPLVQEVASGKKIYFRIYPWTNKRFKQQSVNLYDLRISGLCKKG